MSPKLLCITIAALLVAAVYWLTPGPRARATGTMPQDAYIWQRAWTEAVSDAVTEHGSNFTELIALHAEVSWENRLPRIVRVPVDPAALRGMDRPIGLALRIGSHPGPFQPDDAPARVLTELAASLIAEAAKNHLSVAELQIDFDCAESKLDGYVVWLKAIQHRVRPLPVTITALPSWLKRPAFKRLIAAADGYVLQVHSLERPKADGPFELCDPGTARRAVERAGRLGRPFRVALPTYGYEIAFGPAGQFSGISAEGPARTWPQGTRLREVRADPGAIARLVQAWSTDRPQALSGVIWYRLPVAQERLNWCWPTLADVMSGKIPRPDVHAEIRHPHPALAEIDVFNAGTADHSLPVDITLQWRDARLIAADGLQGFDSIETGSNTVRFQSRDGVRLEPGERRNIGWMRLNKETEVELAKSRN